MIMTKAPARCTFCEPFSFSRKRRETNNKSVAKNRARKKEEKEAKERRMEELRKENQEIEQRTAVHQQVSAIYHCSVLSNIHG